MDEILIYAKYDDKKSIIAIRSNIFLEDKTEWTKIDEWVEGQDRYMYAHADNGEYVQEKHGKPLFDDKGRPNFHDDFVEWTDEKKKELYPIAEIDPEKLEQEANLEALMLTSIKASFLLELPDETAATLPLCFEPWESYIGKSLKSGERVKYNNKLYKVIQNVPVVLENQPPGIETASLYNAIDVEHAGTLEDPIPYDQTMTVHNGKYYVENDIIYKCTRDSGQPLYHTCESLIGHYFERVN